jgi:hypothetical protein
MTRCRYTMVVLRDSDVFKSHKIILVTRNCWVQFLDMVRAVRAVRVVRAVWAVRANILERKVKVAKNQH